MDTTAYEELFDAQVRGRPVVLVGPLAVVGDRMLEDLHRRGAQGVFVIGMGVGTGPLPSEDLADRFVVPMEAADVMEEFREQERVLADPPAGLVAALDRFDPGRQAVVLGGAFVTVRQVAGRRVLGGRPSEYLRYEDKVAVDELWDRAGVPRAPSRIVAPDPDAVSRAARSLDRGVGVVLAADASRGWHGGGHGIRWARTAGELERAVAALASRSERLRVMPFLEGVPCSIHGMVFPGGIAVFRPMELVILRRPGTTDLVYAGSSSTWDPDPSDREEMRRIARAVGETLAVGDGYRGGFTVDGIMSADGFLPTELNTRLGSAFSHVTSVTSEVPWGAIQRGLVAGMPFDARPSELESHAVGAVDAERTIRGVLFGGWRTLDASTEHPLAVRDGRVVAAEGNGAVGTILAGPHPTGMMLLLRAGSDAVPAGDRAAPFVAGALTVVGARLGLDLGDLQPAPSVR